MSIPVWCLLAFAVWTVSVLMVGVGVHRWSLILTGRADLKSFPADEPHGAPLYRRAMRAHANCVENLPVFGVIVFAAFASGYDAPLFDVLAQVVIGARVTQTAAHVASGSNLGVGVRFVFFAAQILSFLAMAALVAMHALGG